MERIKFVEGYRGFATIMVFFLHFSATFYPAINYGIEHSRASGIDFYFGHSPLAFIMNGNTGVVIFLLITGFGTYIAMQSERFNEKKYLITRWFKLMALTLIGGLSVLLLVKLNLIYLEEFLNVAPNPWLIHFKPWLADFSDLLLHNPLASMEMYNYPLWTMKLFFLGALLSYILFRILFKNIKKNLIVYSIFIFIMVINNDMYYIPCILGVFLGEVYVKKILIKPWQALTLFLVGVYLCAYPIYFPAYPTEGVHGLVGYPSFMKADFFIYYHSIGAALILYACFSNVILRGIFESKFFQILGKYSLTIYLLHCPVIISLSSWMFLKLPLEMRYSYRILMIFFVTVIVISMLSVPYRWLIKKTLKCIDVLYMRFVY